MVGAIADWFAVTALFKHPLGPAGPAHRADPAAQGRAGPRAGGVRRRELPAGGHHPRPDRRGDDLAAGGPLALRPGARPAGGRRGRRRRRDRAGQGPRRAHRRPRHRGAGAALPRGADRPAARRPARARWCATTCTTAWSTWRSRSCTTGSSATPRPSPRSWASGRPGGRRRGSTSAVTSRIHLELVRWVADIRDDPRHHARAGARLDAGAARPRTCCVDPDTQARAERLKERLLDHPQVIAVEHLAVERPAPGAARVAARPRGRRCASGCWPSCRRSPSGSRPRTELRGRLDGIAADVAVFAVERYGAELTAVITHTIERWDGKEAAAPHRAARRPRPPVHPDQRHHRRRPGRRADPRGQRWSLR